MTLKRAEQLHGFLYGIVVMTLSLASLMYWLLCFFPQEAPYHSAYADVITFWHLCGAVGFNAYYKIFGTFPLKRL